MTTMPDATLPNGPMVPAVGGIGSSVLSQQSSATAAATTTPTTATTTTVLVGPAPPLTDLQRSELEGYMRRDNIFVSAFERQRQHQVDLLNEKQLEIVQAAQAGVDIFGPGYHPAYRNGHGIIGASTNALQIVYPSQRRRVRKSKEFTFTKAMIEEQAAKEDVLVPIRLEIDVDGLVLRDTFTWNLHETLITPEHFAEVLCEDLQFPVQQFAPQVSRAIRDQIQDYHLPALSVVEDSTGENDKVATEESRPAQELRILIKIDITVENVSLVDQFEWDISCPNNDPEHFAEVLAAELGLGGEFRTAIAHSIREQVQTHTKCLNLIGYNYDGSSVHDEDLRGSFLPKITSILREEEAVEQFTPILEKLTEPEMDKLERDRERDKRRKRRQTRGRRGVILPDREPTKTKRTLLHQRHTPETIDPLLDLQQYDPAQINRLGPTTRRTTMAHDHLPVGLATAPASSLAGQGLPSHYRVTRKLRGSGSDLSVHHLGVPGSGGIMQSYSRDSLHGSKDKLTGGSREQLIHSPMRETTPVQSSKEASHLSPMELRVPQQQISRLGYSTVPDPSLQYSQPTLAHNRRPAMTASNSSSSSVDTAAQVKFVVVENLPESLAQDKARLHQLYPSDHFEIRVRVGSASEGAINTGEVSIADYRVRCLDCPPGKLYNAGPDGTLQNFEVHLKSNRAHRSYVEQKKLQGNQQGSSHPPQLQSQLQSQPQSQSQPQPHPQPQPHLHHPMLPYSLPQSHQNLSLSPSMLNS